jgi:hypothetical protein
MMSIFFRHNFKFGVNLNALRRRPAVVSQAEDNPYLDTPAEISPKVPRFGVLYSNPGALLLMEVVDRSLQGLPSQPLLIFRGLYGLPIGFLGQKHGFLGGISRLLGGSGLPYTYTGARDTEQNQADLCQEYSPLKGKLAIFIGSLGFAISSFFGVLILWRGAEDGDTRLKMYVFLFALVVLFGQGSVFLILQGLWGRI